MKKHYDVVVVGAGVVGLTTALAIASTSPLTVAVIEEKPCLDQWNPSNDFDHRVSAISHASKHILQHLDVWSSIKSKRVSPYTTMVVWNDRDDNLLQFDAARMGEPNLGYIIEDSVMRLSLLEALSQHENISYLSPLKITAVNPASAKMELRCQDDSLLQTNLLIAADGAESSLRHRMNISITSWDYGQTAIVATVKTAKPHQSTAWQRFLSTGPLAFLPLKDPLLSSIVWSVTHDVAARLMLLEEEAFARELECAFSEKGGEVVQVVKRNAFPLRMRHATHYVQHRFALVGDAAHTIHPLAGQGVNLGLLDAAALAEVIADAQQKRRDFASLATLRRYERWRKTDTVAMLAAVEGLKRLFSNEQLVLGYLRNKGLHVVNQLPLLKDFFARYALGQRDDMPSMTRLT